MREPNIVPIPTPWSSYFDIFSGLERKREFFVRLICFSVDSEKVFNIVGVRKKFVSFFTIKFSARITDLAIGEFIHVKEASKLR